MFKGQGANQALADGPLLANWLGRPGLSEKNLPSRLRCFEREMVSRAGQRVLASREAARHLHSPEVVDKDYNFGVEGLGNEASARVLAILANYDITAAKGEHLDMCVAEVIKQLLLTQR
eukprot:gb/GEZN01030969.1/.p1 GENE.gb/GEZN01030969.1/~~gb/GEZN01030969.1/.p1  ORF type:complete len:129 (-),score=14.01 gb/GEZN01030969.1/:55-411(-)